MAHGRRKFKKGRVADEDRRYTVRGIRRDPVDIGKLSKALISLARAEAERQAQAEYALTAGNSAESETTSADEQRSGGDDHD
jgi:hypothetical protein